MQSFARALGFVVIVLAAFACGSASDAPLGGPFGGTASVTPAPGTTVSSAVDASVADDTGSGPPSTSIDSGTDANAGGCTANDGGVVMSSSGDDGGGGAPTWSALYTSYFAAGTIGDCANTACHTEMGTASAMYAWMKSETTTPYCGCPDCLTTLTSSTTSVLSWFGGSMPVAGPTAEVQASSDIEAWVAAGAKNN